MGKTNFLPREGLPPGQRLNTGWVQSGKVVHGTLRRKLGQGLSIQRGEVILREKRALLRAGYVTEGN